MLDQQELQCAQSIITAHHKQKNLTLKEIYGSKWSLISHPTKFGKNFKESVEKGSLRGIQLSGKKKSDNAVLYDIV